MDLNPGTEFAGYVIERELGRGGMGVVYLAEQRFPRRKVALKVLASELARDERFRDRFVRESNLAASMDHPNIVPIHAAGEEDGVLYLAMRYVDGIDLRQEITEQGPLTLHRTALVVSQVASALDAAHRNGMVHRDVKSSNILLVPGAQEDAEHVYLSDFGLTKRMTSDSGLTGTGQFVGTLDYAAPEQFEGKPLDARTDVYSLGCVTYECLTGHVPFPRETEAAQVYAHLHEPPPKVTASRPDIPQAVDEVAAKAMAKAPGNRYPSCGALAAALRDARVPDAQPVSGARPDRRRPAVLAAGAVGAIAVAVVVVLVVLSGQGSEPPGPGGVSTGPRSSPPAASQFPAITGETVVRVDPRTGRVATSMAIPDAKPFGAIAVGEGAVWIAEGGQPALVGFGGFELLKLDPETLDPERITSVRPWDVVVGRHTPVWVVNCSATQGLFRTLTAIDPATDLPIRTIPLGRTGGIESCAPSLALGEGSLWVLDDRTSTVRRYDQLTGQEQGEITVPGATGSHEGIAVGEEAVWVLDAFNQQVVEIDPDIDKVTDTIPVQGAQPVAVATGAGSVWVLADNGTMVVIDAADGTIRKAVRLSIDEPAAVAATDDAVWIVGAAVEGEPTGVILRLDPGTLELGAPIRLGGFPTGVAVDRSGVWVAVGP